MWTALVDGAARAECWATLREIEAALAAHVRDAANASLADPTLANGLTGVALFFAYLDAAREGEGSADLAFTAIERSNEALGAMLSLPALYNGFSGAGWVIAHLTREMYGGDDDLTDGIDEALGAALAQTSRAPFELIFGLAGFGTYLAERLPSSRAAELLTRVVELLDRNRDATGAWFTEPEWLPENQRLRMPRGCYNLGVAHGIPGVIGFLALARREGLADPRLVPLCESAIRFVLAQSDKGDASSLFPGQMPLDDDPFPTRTAWCYGDLGVAAVLLSAGDAFDREDWRSESVRIARIAAARDADDTLVRDVGLCHGAAGLAHIFNRLAQASGDATLTRAAGTWYARTLAMRRPGEGLAGLLSWVSEAGDGGEWRSETGFLTGIAGVGLALLAAVTDVEPAWDRVLLTAIPPRTGGLAS